MHDKSAIKIYGGQLNHAGMQGEVFTVNQVIPSDKYDGHDHDVAILHTNEDMLASGAVIGKIDLATERVPPGTQATVYGWGSVTPLGKDASPVLLRATLNVISQPDCRNLMSGVTERMICAKAEGHASCAVIEFLKFLSSFTQSTSHKFENSNSIRMFYFYKIFSFQFLKNISFEY